jgi:hypothetical protein
MDVTQNSQKLAAYIKGLSDFRFVRAMQPYNHMGATLTDAMFQAGVNYHHAVEPRINKIKTFESASTISGLQSLFRRVNAEEFFNWKGYKPRNFLNIVEFLAKQSVETEADLKRWILLPGSIEKIMDQPGIGRKTVDYLKILVGIPTVAADRHIFTFLERAGIITDNYDVAKATVIGAAMVLNVSPSVLDYSIWCYISEGLI